MEKPHPLERPAWHALRSGWAHLAQGDESALRLNPAYGPFGASADFSESALAALGALVPQGETLWTTEVCALPAVPGTNVVRSAVLHQMVAQQFRPTPARAEILVLGEADAPEMRALAQLTEPGPFSELTHRLGNFVGIRVEGQLVAMAGERMKLDGYCEVSGVCTHPDHRGKSYAAMLMSVVGEGILARGETPFLHSYASNTVAIALYERLGFVHRASLIGTIISRK